MLFTGLKKYQNHKNVMENMAQSTDLEEYIVDAENARTF